MNTPTLIDDATAVFEHTAHSAVVAAVRCSAAVVHYDRAEQIRAERQLVYRHNTADELPKAGVR